MRFFAAPFAPLCLFGLAVAPAPAVAQGADLPPVPAAGVSDTGVLPVAVVRDLPAVAPVFYSLRQAAVVKADGPWDVAFDGTAVRLSGAGRLLDTAFDALAEAPADGLREDAAAAPVVPSGSGAGWYRYDMETHSVKPLAGRTLVLRLDDGTFAKLEITGYYHSATGQPRHYGLRWARQPDGRRALRTRPEAGLP